MSVGRLATSLIIAVALTGCGGSGDEPADEPVGATTEARQAESPQTTPAAEVDFGDDGAATEFLEALFMPRTSVTDEQIDCINEQMDASYPEGLPDLGAGRDEALGEIVDACELAPGG